MKWNLSTWNTNVYYLSSPAKTVDISISCMKLKPCNLRTGMCAEIISWNKGYSLYFKLKFFRDLEILRDSNRFYFGQNVWQMPSDLTAQSQRECVRVMSYRYQELHAANRPDSCPQQWWWFWPSGRRRPQSCTPSSAINSDTNTIFSSCTSWSCTVTHTHTHHSSCQCLIIIIRGKTSKRKAKEGNISLYSLQE